MPQGSIYRQVLHIRQWQGDPDLGSGHLRSQVTGGAGYGYIPTAVACGRKRGFELGSTIYGPTWLPSYLGIQYDGPAQLDWVIKRTAAVVRAPN